MVSRFRFPALATGALFLAVGALLAFTGSASAHERRAVGDYTFIVGFLNEPALLNQPNSIDLRVSKTAESSPVTGLEKTVKAVIVSGSQKLSVDLVPRFGTAGAYNAYFTPTTAGNYSFHFTGAIESLKVDETFSSSASTFSPVGTPVAFPQPLPAIQATDATVKNLQERVSALEDKPVASASSKDSTARALGAVGVVVGVLGLGMAGLGMARKSS